MNYQDFTYNFMNGEVLAMNNVLDPMADVFFSLFACRTQ